MMMFFLPITGTILCWLSLGVNAHGPNPALDPNPPYNSISNKGGPRIYYNGSGDVPGYKQTSPKPQPITPYTNKVKLQNAFYKEIETIQAGNSIFRSDCEQCVAATEILHLAAITLPVGDWVNLLIRYCGLTDVPIFTATCHAAFSAVPRNASEYSSDAGGLGPYWAQLYAKMSEATGDMQAWCYYQFNVCSAPPVIKIDESKYFSPKPKSAEVAPQPSGDTFQVLHLSDWHIDPRYDIGSEANCTQYLCCRPYATNTKLGSNSGNPSIPASRFGYLYCDTPADLAISAFSTMDQFFNKDDIAFTIFTGDIVSHDNEDQISQAYVEYNERQTFETFKAHMKGSPIYATLGNHDNFPEAYNTPNNINPRGGSNAMSYNYRLLSNLWQDFRWLSSSEADYASTHYGAYAHTTKQGLRIISINTDFYYEANVFNYYDFTNPDVSGVLSWLADELSACESRGQRAWIIGHVLSGYDGTNALPNPSALFHSIVRRFSPATIAAVFFGHTHEDQLQIFYDFTSTSLSKSGLRDTSDVDYEKPLAVGYIGPSITPLTGNNAGYQRLHIDAKTFSVMNVDTYIANVSESLTWKTPVWKYEYDTRSTYNVNGINWPKKAPLNATFFHKVTDAMLKDLKLVEKYSLLETKSSIATDLCKTEACAKQTVCYIRGSNAALGLACPKSGQVKKRSCH